MTTRGAVAIAALLLALGGARPARANGRPPATNGIYFRPGDAESLYIATTFGLLISHDGGCTLRWVCESNLGYGGRWDPDYAVAADGTIYATTYTGLRVSRDGGCSFTTVTAELPEGSPGRLAGRFIEVIELGPDGALWAGTSDNGMANDLFLSTDGGVTFASKGLSSTTRFWKSVEVAAARPRRVYASNYELAGNAPDGGSLPPAPQLVRSDDTGETWSELALTGLAFGLTPIVAVVAVDPRDAEIVYVASRGANPPNGDRLYRSSDGGERWSEVVATAEPVHDVVFPDERTVLVTTKNETGVGGAAYRSQDRGAQFARLNNAPRLSCLGQAPDGSLYGCASNFAPDYMALTRSLDGAETFRRLWRFAELAGPVSCPAGTAQREVCEAEQWRGLQAQLSATGPSCGAPTLPDAGPSEPEPGAAKGCCDSGGEASGPGGPLLLGGALGLALLALRRPRRSRRSPR